MREIESQFPEVVRKVYVGETYLKKEIPGYLFTFGTLGLTEEKMHNQTLKKPAILIDGLHHARELSSMSMTVYTMLNILFDYTNNKPETI